MPYKSLEKRREVKRNYMRRIREERGDEYRAMQREWHREYYAKNEKYRLYTKLTSMKRRARTKNASIGKIDIKKLYEEWNGLCGICKLPAEQPLEIDHIVALSRGGPHMQENLQIAHMTCNRRKWAN